MFQKPSTFVRQKTISPRQRQNNQGFALVVVLFSLAILTLLYATTSKTVQNRIGQDAIERNLSHKRMLHSALLGILSRSEPPVDWKAPQFVTVGAEMIEYRLQPTNGLVDLNTANTETLTNLLSGYGVSGSEAEAAIQGFQEWRAQGNRLVRVSHFPNLIDIGTDRLRQLEQIATVYSGSNDVVWRTAPSLLLDHFGKTSPESQINGTSSPTALTIQNYQILTIRADGSLKATGTVHFGPNPSLNRILEY